MRKACFRPDKASAGTMEAHGMWGMGCCIRLHASALRKRPSLFPRDPTSLGKLPTMDKEASLSKGSSGGWKQEKELGLVQGLSRNGRETRGEKQPPSRCLARPLAGPGMELEPRGSSSFSHSSSRQEANQYESAAVMRNRTEGLQPGYTLRPRYAKQGSGANPRT